MIASPQHCSVKEAASISFQFLYRSTSQQNEPCREQSAASAAPALVESLVSPRLFPRFGLHRLATAPAPARRRASVHDALLFELTVSRAPFLAAWLHRLALHCIFQLQTNVRASHVVDETFASSVEWNLKTKVKQSNWFGPAESKVLDAGRRASVQYLVQCIRTGSATSVS